jgi:hypothetical protein
MDDPTEEFNKYCEAGDLSSAQEILKLNPEIDIHSKNCRIFYYCCFYKIFDVAKWLFESRKKINTREMYISLLLALYQNDEIEMIKKLTETVTEYQKYNYAAFVFVLNNGDLEDIEKFIETIPGMEQDDEFIYAYSCSNNRPETVEWIVKKWTGEDYHFLFEIGCICGNYRIIDWLFETIPDSEKYAQKVFADYCINGYQKLAQQILDKYPDINVQTEYQYITNGITKDYKYSINEKIFKYKMAIDYEDKLESSEIIEYLTSLVDLKSA